MIPVTCLTTSQQIGGIDTAVGDLDVHIGLFESLGFVGLVFQLALDGVFVKAHLALEFVVIRHDGEEWGVRGMLTMLNLLLGLSKALACLL